MPSANWNGWGEWTTFEPGAGPQGPWYALRMKKLILSALLVLVGCTAGPELQKYPLTQIDRPMTLPKGVAQWETLIPYYVERDANEQKTLPPIIPVPLFWRSSLSDSLTLNWAPIPVSVTYLAHRNESHSVGLTGGLAGLGYVSNQGLLIGPSLGVSHWFRANQKLSLRTSLNGGFIYRTTSKVTTWTVEMTLSPFFQLTDSLSLTPFLSLRMADALRATLNNFGVTPVVGSATTFPMGLKAVVTLGRQWDLGFKYSFESYGKADGYNLHSGNISLNHSW